MGSSIVIMVLVWAFAFMQMKGYYKDKKRYAKINKENKDKIEELSDEDKIAKTTEILREMKSTEEDEEIDNWYTRGGFDNPNKKKIEDKKEEKTERIYKGRERAVVQYTYKEFVEIKEGIIKEFELKYKGDELRKIWPGFSVYSRFGYEIERLYYPTKEELIEKLKWGCSPLCNIALKDSISLAELKIIYKDDESIFNEILSIRESHAEWEMRRRW